MILRSPFIRLKTNNAASQPTRTRAPVNSFLSFLGRGGSRLLRASTYGRLPIPTPPVTLATDFPPRKVPAAPVEVAARGEPAGGVTPAPNLAAHHHLFHKLTQLHLRKSQGFSHPSSRCSTLRPPPRSPQSPATALHITPHHRGV